MNVIKLSDMLTYLYQMRITGHSSRDFSNIKKLDNSTINVDFNVQWLYYQCSSIQTAANALFINIMNQYIKLKKMFNAKYIYCLVYNG